MKILIFEYISGGGFCHTELPPSLAREGRLMLKALLADFAGLAEHEIVVMLDARCVSELASENLAFIPVNASDNLLAVFEKTLNDCNAAWIIAPETDNILFDFTSRVEKANKLLLSVPSSAIATTADKLATFNILTAHDIATIPTQPVPTPRLVDLSVFENLAQLIQFPLVIKARNGVGCEDSFVAQNQREFQHLINQLNQAENYIIQPFINGEALSVSAIFNHGQAQLICINRQHIQVKNQQFKLVACEVNIRVDNKAPYQALLNSVAQAFPDLCSYVGIDLILADKLYVVEINPRLTSSYSGINQALGINVAALVLQALNGAALIKPLRNHTVLIEIAQEKNHGV